MVMNLVVKWVFIAFVITAGVACSSEGSGTGAPKPYEKLCGIYEGLQNPDGSFSQDYFALDDAIVNEVPVFVGDYNHILNASADRQYQLTQQVVQERTGEDWKCDAMKDYLEWQVNQASGRQ